MKKIWRWLIKPKGLHAKWLVFALLLLLFGMGATGYFDIARQYLDTDAATFQVGDFGITAYGVLNAILVLVLLVWTSAIVSDFVEMRISAISSMRSANRILLLKIVQIAIYMVAGLVALDLMGIDLTSLTIFSGALGIGLGFGLQKIASNFISGLILLFEKSVEQDDLIELADGTCGFVRKSHARYTLLETFDSREILIPNEDLITNRVINWTLSNTKGRIEIMVGVSYAADLELAHQLILAAAAENPRCITDPKPNCFLQTFGESSVDFLLYFWVADVTDGRMQPHSDVMFAIWRKFKEHGIEIPFPQRDVHIRTDKTAEELPQQGQ
jgi:small-conductance mechanosensitive channel